MAQLTTPSISTVRSESNAKQLARARVILARLLAEIHPRDFAIRLWNGETIPPDASMAPRFTLVLNRAGALRRMCWPPNDLALGEAFLRGDFDIEGDLSAAVAVGQQLWQTPRSLRAWLTLGRDLLTLPDDAAETQTRPRTAQLHGARHSRARDRAAIQYHYDVGNEFYALWLDQRMVYSCAYFKTGTESIDTAQAAKLDVICRKLRLRTGEQLLDIGCGWGGLAMHAAQHYSAHVLGVTLSEKQAAYANEQIARAGLGQRVRVQLQDYRDLGAGTFDKIVSVGMFEHVGRNQLPAYFAAVYRLLKPGGVFLNHGIAAQRSAQSTPWLTKFFARDSFVWRYVFPDGELAPIHETLTAAECAGFEVRDVESLREHYTLTLRQWVKRLKAHQTEAVRASDEATYRIWCLYMAASAHAFDSAQVNVYQTLLAKPNARGASDLPLTREDWYV